MAWLHDRNDLPQEGDIIKEVKFDKNLDLAKIIFQSGRHITVQYYNENRGKIK